MERETMEDKYVAVEPLTRAEAMELLDELLMPFAPNEVTKLPNSSPMNIKKVIFNDPATVVFWGDGTKTVVKCHEGDVFSERTGLLYAIAKKVYGNSGRFNDVLRHYSHDYIPTAAYPDHRFIHVDGLEPVEL